MMVDIARRIHSQFADASAIDQKIPARQLYGALFIGAAASFCLARLLGDQFGLASELLSIAGSATCGWSWLLTLALFRVPEARRPIWPLALVLALVAAETFLHFHGNRTTPVVRMIANAETLVSSTLLLLALVEPLKGVHREMAPAELRFRAVFAGGYAMLLTVAVVCIDGASPGSAVDAWGGMIKAVCAGLALVGTGLALRYRGDNPLPEKRREKRLQAISGQVGLGERLVALISDEAVYTLSDLRVADVARRLGEADYKVTQCITGGLGFRNFNHLVNHFRIAAAKRKLADASLDRLPVLTIALDCGFGSIGPFNRAFKAETGMTPVDFRRSGR